MEGIKRTHCKKKPKTTAQERAITAEVGIECLNKKTVEIQAMLKRTGATDERKNFLSHCKRALEIAYRQIKRSPGIIKRVKDKTSEVSALKAP